MSQTTDNDITNALLVFCKSCTYFIISNEFGNLSILIDTNNKIPILIEGILVENEDLQTFQNKMIQLINELKQYENEPQYKEAISKLTSLITETIKPAQTKLGPTYLLSTKSSDAKKVPKKNGKTGGKTKRNRKRKTINMRRKQTRAARNNVQVIRGGDGAAAASVLLGCSLIAAYKCRDKDEKEKMKTKFFDKLGHNFLGLSEPTPEQRGYFGCIYEKTAKYVGYATCIVGSIFVVGVGVGVSFFGDPKAGAEIISYPATLISQIQQGLPAFNSKYFQAVSNGTAAAQIPRVDEKQTQPVDEPKSPFDTTIPQYPNTPKGNL